MGPSGYAAVWIRPKPGYSGNHVFIDGGAWVFDYHGYAAKRVFVDHVWRGAGRRWPGWDGEMIALPPETLVSERLSRRYDGLWLREPRQFLHDAMPRAHAYLRRFAASPHAAQHD